jgi:predicted enzyme related to lactoylglutathione lyase
MSQHSIVHIEIPATDPAAAGKFYAGNRIALYTSMRQPS